MRAISAPVKPESASRSAGFLTTTEREYLLDEWDPSGDGPGNYSKQQERSKRSDIKTRTRHAIADFALIEKHADRDLIRNVIEREQSTDDDIPTFYDNTIENAQYGLANFMLRLALDQDRAENLIEALRNEDLEELFSDTADDVSESKQLANDHEQMVAPTVAQLKQYATANDISKSQMLDIVQLLWE